MDIFDKHDLRTHFKGCCCDLCDCWSTDDENDPRLSPPSEIKIHYQDCECILCIKWSPYPEKDTRPIKESKKDSPVKSRK